MNKGFDPYTGVGFVDTLGIDQIYVLDSFTATASSSSVLATASGLTEPPKTTSPALDKNILKYKLPSPLDKDVTITYKTRPTASFFKAEDGKTLINSGKKILKNKGELWNVTGGAITPSAIGWVNIPMSFISKAGKKLEGNEIEWTLTFNGNSHHLTDLVVYDEFDGRWLDYKGGSLKVTVGSATTTAVTKGRLQTRKELHQWHFVL